MFIKMEIILRKDRMQVLDVSAHMLHLQSPSRRGLPLYSRSDGDRL